MTDADVARASTPPADFYLDPQRLEPELRGWARGWQLVGHAGQLAAPGDFVTTEAGREPLLLVNDGGTLRGFFNVCRHRAGPVATGCGHASRLVCRYHGWSYDLAGRLLRAPEMEGAAGFDPASIRLEPVALQPFGPLLFAALDRSAPSFDEYFPGLSGRCQGLPLGLDAMHHVLTREYPVAANWKLYVDNFLEGYHIPLVHPALDRELDYRSYVTELGARHVLQYAPIRAATAAHYRGTPGGEPSAWYFWLFPNVMLNFYQGQLQTNVVIPLAVDRTLVRFDWYATDRALDPMRDPRFQELLGFSESVQAEDAAICAAVHRNLGSAAFRPGRYSPLRESGVHLFHRLLQAG